MATEFFVNSQWTDEAAFNADASKPAGAIWGSTAFNNLQNAVNAASATEPTTITVAAGTYSEDIVLDARSMEQKGNLKFVAAEGADVIFAGKITIGYYEKKVGSKKWDADVAFENITFDQAAAQEHSIDIQQCNDFAMTNCKVIGDGEYGILGTNVDNGATITGTTFENAGIQSAGSFGTNFLIDDCTFNDSKVNIQSGNSVTIKDCTFDSTLTDANVGDSFYCIRSNDNAINIENTTFNIDSDLTEDAGAQAKWGVLWQRNVGGTKWSASDIEVNFSEKAMAQSGLLFNKNGTTNAANEADRITINGLNSNDNDVTDLLAKSEGVLNAAADGKFSIYDDGQLIKSVTFEKLYVDSSFTAENVGEGKIFGGNAFTSFVDALKAVTANTERIEISSNIIEDIPAELIEVALSRNIEIVGIDEAASVVMLNNGGYKYLVFGSAEGAEDVAVKISNIKIVAPQTQVIFGNSAYAEDSSIVYSPVNAEIDGSSQVSAYVVAVEYESTVNVLEGGKFFSTGEVMSVKGTLNVTGNDAFDPAGDTLTGDDRQIVAHYMWDYGTVELNDTFASIYSQLRLRGADSSFTADNSLIEIGKKVDGTWMENPSANGVGWINADGTMTLTNKTIMRVNGATGRDGYGMTINAGGEFNVESGSTAEFSAGVKNDGTINVENGTLIVGNSWTAPGTQPPATALVNNGAFNVSGESTLDIADLTGNTITALDGATLKDSTIASAGSVELVIGEAGVASTVTFEGDNKVAKIAAGNGDKIVVGAGASLDLTGARSAFGGGAEWDIDGEIVDAKKVTADEKAAMTASLNLAQGLSVSETNGKESVLNADNAYVTWGREVTTKNTNSANGKLTLNFTNSIVDGAGKVAINPTKAGYDAANAPEVEMNFKDSVVEINNYFTNNHAKGTVSIDNTDFTATAFGNVGEFNVTNGSKVNFSLINNGLNDWAGKGSLNAGTITVDASELTIVNKTATLEFYNVGDITLSNGATFTLDQLVNAKANDLTGSGNISTTFADMVGSITIDATSQLAVSGKFENAGTITIDGANFAGGTKKVIDLNIDSSLKDVVTVENLGEGASVVYGEDGDVLITDASMQKLYVNSAYADKDFGAADGDKVFGINAFGSLVEALDAKTADTEEIVIESDITEALPGKTISGKLTADSDVTIADSANNNYVNFTGTTLGENITVDAKYFYLYGENTFNGNVKSSTTFYSSGKLTMNGNAEVYTTMSRYYVNADDGIYVVGTAAAGEGKNAAVQYKSNNYLGHYSGTFSVKDTAAEFGYILLNGDTDGDGYSKATLVADNASIKTVGGPNTQPGQVLMNGDSSIVATNGSVLDFRGPKDFGYISMGANNSISLTDSEMYLGKDGQSTSALAGTITLKNSTLNSLGKLNSTAAITIDATSSIVATTITGTGTITIDVKGYTGDTFKAIDVNSAIANTVKLTNASNKYYLTYGEDGDVYVNKSPDFVYVSSDYNSSTEGWGVTKFGSWDGAYAFTSTNAKKATIVFEKTTTISGNCFPKQADGVAAIIVKDGASVGNANSKWDAVFAMTIEAGGILQSARPASAGYGNTHVKNKWIIGEAGADKQAKILFVNGKNGINYQTMSIALLSGLNRSITANNALIEVGDFGINAAASFTDTTLTIEGILAIKGTSLYKTTMTDTEVTIKGHNLMNENTYYSTVGTILATLTMDNSSIEVDDKADTTAAEKVWLGYTGNTAQTLTMTNGSSITVEKDTEVAVANKVVMTDSSITAGNINAGDTKYAGSSSFYFNQLEKGKVYYAVLYDAEGNELETIVRTSTSGSTFYPKFSVQPAGSYTAKCFKDEAKTELHQEKTYTFTAVGTMDLTNSDLYAEKLTLAGNNVSMDIDSTIGFSSIEGGYITVKDAADYVDNAGVNDGTYKLFDYTGTGAMTEDDYKALLNNVWHDNYKVVNNDLFLTDQDTGTIYVNSAWAGSEKGDIIGDYIYGFNAASSLKEIGSMIATDGSDTVIKFESDIEDGSVVFNYGKGDITFTADKAVMIKQNTVADWDFVVSNVDSTITIGENVTFQINENASGLYVYNGAGLKVEGTVTGGANWGCAYLAFGDHSVEATGTLSVGRVHLAWTTLTVNGDAASDRTDAHVDSNYLLVEESTFTAKNAIINVGAVHDSNNGGLCYGASEFNIKDSVFAADSVTLKHADSKFNVTGETTINIGTLTGSYVKFEDATIVGDSAVGGNIRTFGDFEVAADFTTKQSNFYGTTTIKSGAVYTGSTTIVGGGSEFTLESGAELNSRFFNVVGGTADIAGEIVLEHSDPRQKLLQIHEDGVANINEGAAVTINRHNAIVNAGGTLNVNGGSLIITADTVNVAPDRGGVIYNAGTVNVNGGLVDIKTLSNTSEVVVNGGTLDADNMDLLSSFKLDGLTAGDARTITVAFVPAGESEGGFTKQFQVAANATSVNANFTDVADGKYNLTVIDGTNVFTTTTEIVNGTLDVTGGKLTLDTLNLNKGDANITGDVTVNIGTLNGTIKLTDAALSDSSVAGGKVVTYGDNAFSGTNNIDTLNVGYPSGYEISEATSVAITGDYTGKAIVVGSLGTMNIGAADAARTTMYVAGSGNWINGSKVSIANADVEFKNALSMTGDIALDNANLKVTWEGQMNTGNGTGKVVLTNGSTLEYTSYFYIGGYYETSNAVLTVTDSAVKGTTLLTSDKAVITLDNGDLTATTKLSLKGSIAMDLDSTITFADMTVNGGTITIDMSDINNANGNKIFDYTGSDTAAWDLDAYKAILGNSSSDIDKFFAVENGDLIVKSSAVVYVNGSYTDVANNQYKTLEEAVASGAGRIITTNDTVSSAVGYNGAEGIIQGGTYNGTVSGGAITAGSDYKKDWQDTEGDYSLSISGGSFNKIVMGANRVNAGLGEHVGNVDLTISGGTFNQIVVGGMVYADTTANAHRGQAILTGDVNLTISGGSFSNYIYGGNLSGKAAYAGCTMLDGNINITIDAVSAIDFKSGCTLVAGSYRNGEVWGDITVTVKGDGANLTMHDDFQIWGGCSSDVYLADADRTFQSSVTGDRTFVFDEFTGDFDARIRGFAAMEIVGGSEVNITKGNLNDIQDWTLEAGSMLTGNFDNNFAGDDLVIDLGEWSGDSCELMSGAASMFNGIESLAGVSVGSDTLTFDGVSKWASASYELELKDGEDGKKVLAFSKLA